MEEITVSEETQKKPLILWLEDDPYPTLFKILNFFFQVEQVGTADEMRQRLRTKEYDGLILDIMLPAGADDLYPDKPIPRYMAGIKMLELILKGDFAPLNEKHIPLVVVSGVGLLDIQIKIEELVQPHSSASYLTKPVAPEEIISKLNKLLKKD